MKVLKSLEVGKPFSSSFQGRPVRPRSPLSRRHDLSSRTWQRQRLRGEKEFRGGGAAADGRDVGRMEEDRLAELQPERRSGQLLLVERPLAGGPRAHEAGRASS